MQWQDERRGRHHGEITKSQFPHIGTQQAPDPHSQRVPGIFDIAQHGRNHHDKQRDPEKDEEATEVMIVALGVKMGHAGYVVDGIEEAIPSPHLLAGRRD